MAHGPLRRLPARDEPRRSPDHERRPAGRRSKSSDLTDVATFRASGNVVFDGPDGVGEEDVATKIEAGLAESLGYDVPVFLRSCEAGGGDRRPASRSRPPRSRRRPASSRSRCCPTRRASCARKEALALATDEDRLAIEGSELFWLPSGGITESDLDLKTLEAELGPWTMRTMGTIEQIAAKHCA